MIKEIKNFIQRKRNTKEITVEKLKAELYDKNQEIEDLKQQLKVQRKQLAKVRALPTAKKRELGLL